MVKQRQMHEVYLDAVTSSAEDILHMLLILT